ncbi:MAG: trehalose-6-phosphate synthase [Acidobacteriota bacterium]
MTTWTKDSLGLLVAERLGGQKLIAVSNREPYPEGPANGLTTAMEPILRASGGTWVAQGTGNRNRRRADIRDRVHVPPEAPAYTLRRVWLPEDVETEYYYGLAREGLWPLCHIAFRQPRFSFRSWKSFRRANEMFAQAVLEEAAGKPAFVFIQGYQLSLLPGMLKRHNPNLAIAQFWQIPWPNSEVFRTFPWKDELFDGLLGNDLLGFHVRHHCANFIETIDRHVESFTDEENGRVTRAGHATTVRPYPVGIDFAEHSALAASEEVGDATGQWLQELGTRPEILGIGIDRIDYTKGIPERLHALDRLFEEHPEYTGRLVFLQVGLPGRIATAGDDVLNQELLAQVAAMNRKWGRGAWRPVIFVRKHVEPAALMALHLMADFCMVTSLHDGMNLVAKEFVASRIDADGVLILSAFTGAARELTDALIVNPFAVQEMADVIHDAINMPAPERRRRMNKCRAAVSANNIYRWAGKIIGALSGVEVGQKPYNGIHEVLKAGAA